MIKRARPYPAGSVTTKTLRSLARRLPWFRPAQSHLEKLQRLIGGLDRAPVAPHESTEAFSRDAGAFGHSVDA